MSHSEPRPHRWSYTNLSMMRACQRKFAFKYLFKVQPDAPDETKAFFFGTCFHAYLEVMKHEPTPMPTYSSGKGKFKDVEIPCLVDEALLGRVIQEELKNEKTSEEWDPIELHLLRLQVGASLQAYFLRHRGSGLKWLASEVEIGEDDFIGFVDVVFEDPLGRWWIADLKTAASVRVDELVNSLATNTQLGLYTLYMEQIAEKLNLNPNMFAGVRYITTTKTKAEMVKSFPEFVVKNAPKSYDFVVPQVNMVFDNEIVIKAKGDLRLIQAEKDPMKIACNPSECMAYFKPCPFWSYCHGGKKHGDHTGVTVISEPTQYKWSTEELI